MVSLELYLKYVSMWHQLYGPFWIENIYKADRPLRSLCLLHFLKNYCTEQSNDFVLGCSEKTFGKWSWYFVNKVSELPIVSNASWTWDSFIFNLLLTCWPCFQISWWRRCHIMPEFSEFLVSFNATEYRIYDPSLSNSKWFSHKCPEPDLRYEIGIYLKLEELSGYSGLFLARRIQFWKYLKMFTAASKARQASSCRQWIRSQQLHHPLPV